ncbi:MAG: DUF1801 domain-containing protein [bacterium]|nr:DUF1801 domain-containing protein [bacterium]
MAKKAKKKAAKKPAAKRAASKKPAAKKAAARKAGKKKTTKKAAKRKPTSKKKTAKKPAAKKKAVKKPAVKKKPAANKKAVTKPAAKKAAKKAATKKVAKRAPAESKGDAPTFEKLFEESSPEVRRVARELRDLVRATLPNAEETIYPGWRIALYKVRSEVCGIQPAGDRCNFYITKGTEVSDPDKLLEGTGKGIRHVKVYATAEVPVPALRRLLRAARKLDG